MKYRLLDGRCWNYPSFRGFFPHGVQSIQERAQIGIQPLKRIKKEKPWGYQGFQSARRGIEPPWLLTASTSTRQSPHDSNNLAELERQGTSESVPKRHILATCSQNAEPADLVADRLRDAWRAWAETHEPRELRKVLLAILGLLDG